MESNQPHKEALQANSALSRLHLAPPRAARGAVVASLVVIFVLTYYVWVISVGTWTQWPSYTHEYDDLADGFLHGQLSLLTQPDPALLALPNPYDPQAFKGIDFPVDVSFYNGKFWLYFAPLPAVLLAGIKLLLNRQIGDEYLSFAFICGLLVVQSLLALKLWRRFFPNSPARILAIALLTIGLALPAGWELVLTSVHGVAVMGGAFFFMAGTLAAFTAIESIPPSRSMLVLAGGLWAAAVCTRITQLLPVSLATLLLFRTVWVRWPRGQQRKQAWYALLAFALPLALAVGGLGWYNWQRFGSPLETGIRYQMTNSDSPQVMQQHRFELFSPLYVIQNAYNYLAAPPYVRPVFPFLTPIRGARPSIIPGFPLPEIYFAERVTGVLFSVPFIAFAAWTIMKASRRRLGEIEEEEAGGAAYGWLLSALWASSLASIALFLAYFWGSERFMGDMTPPLYLLSVLGFYEAGNQLGASKSGRRLYIVLGFLLLGGTIVLSSLLTLSLNEDGFRSTYPDLWRSLRHLSQGDFRYLSPELWRRLNDLIGTALHSLSAWWRIIR